MGFSLLLLFTEKIQRVGEKKNSKGRREGKEEDRRWIEKSGNDKKSEKEEGKQIGKKQ